MVYDYWGIRLGGGIVCRSSGARISHNKIVNNQALAYYMYLTQDFLISAGVDPKKFRFRKHGDNELAHYATECWDAELYSERFGWIECVGIADRSAYDLNSHIKSSGTDMYAQRKYEKPKIMNVKKIVPNMGKLGPLFKDKAGKIKDILENMELKEENITIIVDGEKISKQRFFLDEKFALLRVTKLKVMKIDTLICGAISNPAVNMLRHYGITVITGIAGNIDRVTEEFLRGDSDFSQYRLPGFTGKGYCQQKRERRQQERKRIVGKRNN